MHMSDRRLSDDPQVLNPFGELIVIPVWLIRHLDKMKMLYWNRKAKRYQMNDGVFVLLSLAKNTSGFVPKPLQAFNIEHVPATSKDSGHVNPIVRSLGADYRGLNVSLAKTRQLEDEYREPETVAMRKLRAEMIVNEVHK